MQKAARYSLLAMFAALVGYSMFLAGMHPVRVLLVATGLSLFVAGTNAIGTRGRRRRGKEEDLFASGLDLFALTRRDWLDLGYITLGAVALIVVGLVAFGGGPN